jgi:cell division protein FtsQ
MTTAPVRRRPAPVASTGPRLAARAKQERRERRRRRLRLAGRTLLLLLPLAAVGWVLLGSSWLAVDRVEIRGASRLSVAEVRTAVGVDVGTPLARVDVGEVSRAVAALPPVADVEVQRSWPGTLRVVVRERTAVAGVLEGRSARLVDAHGVPFATEPRLPAGVVRLVVPEVAAGDPSVLAALAVHRALPEALRSRVQVVKATSPDHVVLLLEGRQQVQWGSPDDSADKAVAALALVDLPGDVVDVRSPGVAVRR